MLFYIGPSWAEPNEFGANIMYVRQPNTLPIIYNSDLIISNPVELSTLAIFYDQLLLPYTTEGTSGFFVRLRSGSAIGAWVDAESADAVADWTDKHAILFREGVIRRLPPPPQADLLRSDQVHFEGGVMRRGGRSPELELLYSLRTPAIAERLSLLNTLPLHLESAVAVYGSIKQDVANHLLRQDLELPQIFVTNDQRPPRDTLIALEAKAIFTYILPASSQLPPEQILEVRAKVKDTREGFSMHLQKLSKGVDDKLKDGEPLADVEWWAARIIETELLPDYREFRRQLSAERSGFWGKIFDAAGKVLEVDASPWTPKFYGQLMKAIGISISDQSAKQKERLTNKSQAFQFMAFVEDTTSLG